MYRPIADTNERYIINEEGHVLDTHPGYMEHMEWQWESIDPTQPREVTISSDDRFSYVKNNGRATFKSVYTILQETFPELYKISDKNKQRIIDSYKNEDQKTYTININDFNRLIYPNKLMHIYDITNNGKKYKNGRPILPTVMHITKNQNIMLHKDRKYFALGTKNIIHFDKNGLPYNTKAWAEPMSTTSYYANKKREKKLI